MKHKLQNLIGCAILTLFSTIAFAQKVTISSMNGKVVDEKK
ncbi:MAG: hypothetical protein OEW67_08425 [Cyclobacteriaceae bacterium]|nr:hypothetical protein [Cyclobacteriaceae bacterium]